MTMIINGTNGLTYPNSSTQASSSVVLQVVNATYSTQVGNSTSTYSDTNLTATITPKFANSKILVIATVNGLEKSSGNVNNSVNLKLLRNSTDLSIFLVYAGWMNATTTLITPSGCVNYLDSPATISATTYKVQFKNENNGSAVFVQSSGSSSFITLMEIAG